MLQQFIKKKGLLDLEALEPVYSFLFLTWDLSHAKALNLLELAGHFLNYGKRYFRGNLSAIGQKGSSRTALDCGSSSSTLPILGDIGLRDNSPGGECTGRW